MEQKGMPAGQDDSKMTEKQPESSTTVEWLSDAQDATVREQSMGIRRALKRYPKAAFWSLAMSTTIIMEGYDTMLIGNLFAQPAFKKHYGQRTAKGTYQIPAPWQAGLKNGADCGCIVGLLLAGYISERLGFRKTMLGGLALISAFIFIQFFAPSIEVLLVAQILFGMLMLPSHRSATLIWCLQEFPLAYSKLCPLCTLQRLHRSH